MKSSKIVGGMAVLTLLGLRAQPPLIPIVQSLRARHLYLIDLRNDEYRVAFPKEGDDLVSYNNQSNYIYSVVAPNGRSLFCEKRVADTHALLVEDILVKRSLDGRSVGREEIISTPFSNLFQFAVSANEEFIAIAGRLRHAAIDKRDAIFLLNRRDGTVKYIAAYASLSESIRNLNVNDHGTLIIYEDAGKVMRFEASLTKFVLTEHYAGRFPALMPDGRGYVYADQGWLVLKRDKEVKRELFQTPHIVGAIRAAPDGRFVAFGVDPFGNLSLTHLRVCELESRTCDDGPSYSDWIAAREAFWMMR